MTYALRDMDAEQLAQHLQKGDDQGFLKALEDSHNRYREISLSMAANSGFVGMNDYHPPRPPEQHSDLEIDKEYLESIRELLAQRGAEMPGYQQGLVARMADNYEERLRAVEEQEAETGTRTYSQEGYRYLADTASAMQYVLRPHDTEFWKLHDNADRVAVESRRMIEATNEPLTHIPSDVANPEDIARQMTSAGVARRGRNAALMGYASGLEDTFRSQDPEEYRHKAAEAEREINALASRFASQGGLLETQDPRIHHTPSFSGSGTRVPPGLYEEAAESFREYATGVQESLKDQQMSDLHREWTMRNADELLRAQEEFKRINEQDEQARRNTMDRMEDHASAIRVLTQPTG
jgi:hypothetical protein